MAKGLEFVDADIRVRARVDETGEFEGTFSVELFTARTQAVYLAYIMNTDLRPHAAENSTLVVELQACTRRKRFHKQACGGVLPGFGRLALLAESNPPVQQILWYHLGTISVFADHERHVSCGRGDGRAQRLDCCH